MRTVKQSNATQIIGHNSLSAVSFFSLKDCLLGSARCVVFQCPLHSFSGQATLKIHARLWNSSFIEVQKKNTLTLQSLHQQQSDRYSDHLSWGPDVTAAARTHTDWMQVSELITAASAAAEWFMILETLMFRQTVNTAISSDHWIARSKRFYIQLEVQEEWEIKQLTWDLFPLISIQQGDFGISLYSFDCLRFINEVFSVSISFYLSPLKVERLCKMSVKRIWWYANHRWEQFLKIWKWNVPTFLPDVGTQLLISSVSLLLYISFDDAPIVFIVGQTIFTLWFSCKTSLLYYMQNTVWDCVAEKCISYM